MYSKTLTTTAVIALALAMFMAWAGHTYSLPVTSGQPAWEIAQDVHRSHGEESSSSHDRRLPERQTVVRNTWKTRPQMRPRFFLREEKRWIQIPQMSVRNRQASFAGGMPNRRA